MKTLESYHNWNNKALKLFADMKECQQNPIHHGEIFVYLHTQMVVSEVEHNCWYTSEVRRKRLLFTAILHDIAKPICTKFEDEDWVSPRHAIVGEKMSRELIWNDFSFEEREQIAALIRFHGLPIWFDSKENPERAILEASLRCNLSELAFFAECDFKGRICKDLDECLFTIELFKERIKELECAETAYNFTSDWARLHYFKNGGFRGKEIYEPDGATFTMMVGLPGSGKSTHVSKNWSGVIVELDEIRKRLKIKPTDKDGQGLVAQTAKEELRVQLRRKENVLLNSTNITKNMRSSWIDLALLYNAKINIVYVDCSLEQALKQNKEREAALPETIIERLSRKLEIPQLSECHKLKIINN